MKTRAAIAFGPGQPLKIMEVDLEGPKAGEVLIEIKAIAYSHLFTSDLIFKNTVM